MRTATFSFPKGPNLEKFNPAWNFNLALTVPGRKISRTPAEPCIAPWRPRRTLEQIPLEAPGNPLQGKCPRRASRTLRAQRLKKFNLAWNFQSRLKISILTSRIPHKKKRVWWGARLNFSISLENFKILNFFNLWALWVSECGDSVNGPNLFTELPFL